MTDNEKICIYSIDIDAAGNGMAQKGLPSIEVKDIDGNSINVQSI